MRVLYYINDEGWKQVSYEEYSNFDGEKKQVAPTEGLILLQSLLLPLRFG